MTATEKRIVIDALELYRSEFNKMADKMMQIGYEVLTVSKVRGLDINTENFDSAWFALTLHDNLMKSIENCSRIIQAGVKQKLREENSSQN